MPQHAHGPSRPSGASDQPPFSGDRRARPVDEPGQESEIVPDKNGQPDWNTLSALLKKAKSQFPDKDDVQLVSEDSVLFARLTEVMDTTIAAGFPSVSLVPSSEAGL